LRRPPRASPDISQTLRAESKRRAGVDFPQAFVGRLF
jgi:hypothetical protein